MAQAITPQLQSSLGALYLFTPALVSPLWMLAVSRDRTNPRTVNLHAACGLRRELEYPRETLQSLMKAVKKGGKIVFVEYRAFDPDVPIKPLHTMSVAQVQKEAEDLGLKYEKAESLSWQNMITFINP